MILPTSKFDSADPQILKPQVTNAGRSALWIAAGTGHAAAVQFLLQLSAVSGVKVNSVFGVIAVSNERNLGCLGCIWGL